MQRVDSALKRYTELTPQLNRMWRFFSLPADVEPVLRSSSLRNVDACGEPRSSLFQNVRLIRDEAGRATVVDSF
jgi:hypothetical protein